MNQTLRKKQEFTEELIGQGSFGLVYLITQGLEKWCCKRMKKQANQRLIKKQKRESLLLRMCQHQNLVRFLGENMSSSFVQIYMDLCPGRNLSYFLETRNSIDDNIIDYFKLKVFLDCINGVIAIRNNLIAHRDIKHENIMVQVSENKINAKIIDFGEANIFIDMRKSRVGTNITMAPQVYLAKYSYTDICDNWSLGIIFYQLFNLQKNWKSQNFYPFERFENYDCEELKNFYSRAIWEEGIILDRKKIPQCIRSAIRGFLTPDPNKRLTLYDLIQQLIDVFQTLKIFFPQEQRQQKASQELIRLRNCKEVEQNTQKKKIKIKQHYQKREDIKFLSQNFIRISWVINEKNSQGEKGLKIVKIFMIFICKKVVSRVNQICELIKMPFQEVEMLEGILKISEYEKIISISKEYSNYLIRKQIIIPPNFQELSADLYKWLKKNVYKQDENELIFRIVQLLL